MSRGTGAAVARTRNRGGPRMTTSHSDRAVLATRPDGTAFWIVTGGPGGGGEALVEGDEPVVYSFELPRLLDPATAVAVVDAKAIFGRGTKVVLVPDWDPERLAWRLLG